MKAARPAAAAQLQTLRHEPWGRVSLLDAGLGGPAQLIEKWAVPAELRATAVALSELWATSTQLSLLNYQGLEADVGHLARVAQSPRGPTLAALLHKSPPMTERAVAALFVDLGEALLEAHARGGVAGSIAPECLVICPVGDEKQPPLTLLHAGLTQLLQAARVKVAVQFPAAGAHSAPEVTRGEWPGPAADAYQFAACMARCLGDDQGELGPLLAACQNTVQEPRVVALSVLVGALRERTQGLPCLQLGDPAGARPVVAAWQRGSPLVGLAAWMPAQPWHKHDEMLPLSPTAGLPARAAGPAPVAGADAAKLQAALAQLRMSRQEPSDERLGLRRVSLRSLVAVLTVLAAATAWFVARQLAELHNREAAMQNEIEQQALRPPPPPRPQPRLLSPE